jgi:hypothetical protein
MTKEEQKILSDSLSKLFKIEPETLASLYNEAGELSDFSKILELDAQRITKYKSDSDNQYKRGVKEGASKIEKEVKEKFELDSDLLGVDLIDHLVVKKIEEAKAAGTKDITKHPEFIKLQVSIDKQLKDRDKVWEDKIEAKEKEYSKAKLFEKVREKALLNLSELNPILPQDVRKAQTWKETFLNELRQASYMEGEDGTLIVLNSEGKPLQTPHGKNVTFDEFSKETADKYFEYPVSEQRSSPGNKPDPKNNGQTGFIPPKTAEEYMQRLRDPKITSDQRIQLTEFGNVNFK